MDKTTHFGYQQVAESEKILRACVHCGFCTATCPTYVVLGDELDSPRGRIYLIKDMLENSRAATRDVVKHIDRCLSCLACMTTCPAGVHYMHLVDHGRDHIERTYKRPLFDRAIRALLANVLPYNDRFRLALVAGWVARPFAPILAEPDVAPVDHADDQPAPSTPENRSENNDDDAACVVTGTVFESPLTLPAASTARTT